MPLVGMLDGERIESWTTDAAVWLEVKKGYKARELLMMCGQPGVPKTSQLGFQFFAHKTSFACGLAECREETAAHRELKTIIASAAQETGWTATIEYPAADRTWIADVLAEKDGQRMALEVQWSKQSSNDFIHRQERYQKAGIDCFWFVHRRNRQTVAEAKVPHLVFDGDVLPYYVMARAAFSELAPVPLAEAVGLLLNGQYLNRIQAEAAELVISYKPMSCNVCSHESTVWKLGAVRLRSRCQSMGTFAVSYPLWATERIESTLTQDVIPVLNGMGLPPVAPLRTSYSNTLGRSYLAHNCAHCSSGFFGDWFIGNEEDWEEITLFPTVDVPAGRDLLEQLHLCRDRGFGTCSQKVHEQDNPTFTGTLESPESTFEEEDDAHEEGSTSGKHAGASANDLVGTVTVTEALAAMFRGQLGEGSHTEIPTTSRPAKARGQERAVPAVHVLCDLCGTEPHPEYECLWRQLRHKVARLGDDYHYSDDIYQRIARGEKPLDEGAAMMRRLLERAHRIN